MRKLIAIMLALVLMLTLTVPVAMATTDPTETTGTVETTAAAEDTTGAADETTGAADETTEAPADTEVKAPASNKQEDATIPTAANTVAEELAKGRTNLIICIAVVTVLAAGAIVLVIVNKKNLKDDR